MARDTRADVEPGQCFEHNGAVWVVVGVSSFQGIPHARIVKINDPTEHKFISISALLKRSDFTPA